MSEKRLAAAAALMVLAAFLVLAGCSATALRTDDPRRAVALAPFSRTVGIGGAIHVREGEVLYPGAVDGEPAWCSAAPIYFAIGEARTMCLFDPTGVAQAEGWFRTGYVAGTLSVFRLDVEVPYRVAMTPPLPRR